MVVVDTAPKTLPKFTQWQHLLALVDETAICSTTTAKWRPCQCLAESRGQGLKTPKIRRHSGLDTSITHPLQIAFTSLRCGSGNVIKHLLRNSISSAMDTATRATPQRNKNPVIRTPSNLFDISSLAVVEGWKDKKRHSSADRLRSRQAPKPPILLSAPHQHRLLQAPDAPTPRPERDSEDRNSTLIQTSMTTSPSARRLPCVRGW